MTLRKMITRYIFGLGVLLYRSIILPFGLCKVYKEVHKPDEPAGSRPTPAEIVIEAQQIEGKIDPFIYGNFIEVLGKCIYGKRKLSKIISFDGHYKGFLTQIQ